MQPKTGLSPEQAQGVAARLSQLLADEYVLYTKTRNAHWNVVGADFHAMHKFFESQYETLDGIIDDVAERIRTLGPAAPGTLRAFLAASSLREQPEPALRPSADFLLELLADHETLARSLREDADRFADDYKDVASSDFVTGLVETHEKMAWMLRAGLGA